jgi:DNA recombination protein RmuC
MDTISLSAGIAIGATLAAIILHFYQKSKGLLSREEQQQLTETVNTLEVSLKVAQERNENVEEDLDATKAEWKSERDKSEKYAGLLAAKSQELLGLQEKLREQKKEIEDMHEQLQIQFKNLANEILEEKTKRFTDLNKVNLGDILTPLKEKIQEFEKKVEQTNKESIARNSALKEQITGLRELNLQITKEAENLTKALKGESKTQGNWGEFVLESILEKSGLIKGEQYETQVSKTADNSKRLQPDVVLHLPEDKHIIIDSKVSLTAYEKFTGSIDEPEREREIKNHLLSIRSHIRALSEKNYQSLYDLGSLDFVLLFMPIESAFSLAVQSDPELFTDAYDKNIVIVSPSTLIATLRTIASIWRQENQNRNALEIARQGGQLCDKFVAFSDDLIKIGENLNTTKKNYELAMNKLSDGKGNLVTRTEKLRELGAKATKNMDRRLLGRAKE